jgi:hypothetical protein
MISTSFKKQLIVNAYKTQLLPLSNTIDRISISTIKRIQNLLLFKKDESLWVRYKYKNNNIDDDDIRWFLFYLATTIYSIYHKSDIQKNISSDIERTLYKKQNIEDNPDYAKYLEDVHD